MSFVEEVMAKLEAMSEDEAKCVFVESMTYLQHQLECCEMEKRHAVQQLQRECRVNGALLEEKEDLIEDLQIMKRCNALLTQRIKPAEQKALQGQQQALEAQDQAAEARWRMLLFACKDRESRQWRQWRLRVPGSDRLRRLVRHYKEVEDLRWCLDKQVGKNLGLRRQLLRLAKEDGALAVQQAKATWRFEHAVQLRHTKLTLESVKAELRCYKLKLENALLELEAKRQDGYLTC